jgi:hypothetical protein
MRGHRVHIVFTAVASGIQAHSSTGRGRNANWDLLPFLMDMRALHERLRKDAALQDPDYDPPFSDFNLVLDNHGSAVNVTVPKATATIKFRYSAKVDPQPVADIVRDAARRAGLALSEAREGRPPELPETHPLGAAVQRGFGPGTARGRIWHRRLGASGPGALRHHGTRRHRSGACSRGERGDRGACGRRSRFHAPGASGGGSNAVR